ncbi:MAG: metal ABC transporter solute-binding protein, Zn/Mn family [Janthinobacterium lividum]
MPPRLVLGSLALGLTTALTLTGCGSGTSTAQASTTPTPGGGELSIVTSTTVYGSIAHSIAGDAATVTSVISDPSADPHSYEASTRTQLELSRADLVIENGGGYDDFMQTMLSTLDSQATVLNAVELSGRTASAGAEVNEHVWYDVATVRILADAIERALATASPDDAATFEANAATFDAGLDALQQKITGDAATTKGQRVAITEPVPGYLLDALGAVNATPEEFSAAIEEDSDVPVDVLQETLALFDAGPDQRVRALVYNEQTTGPQTERVLKAAKDNGIAVVPVTETLPQGPDGKDEDYTTWMTHNVDAIAAALRA